MIVYDRLLCCFKLKTLFNPRVNFPNSDIMVVHYGKKTASGMNFGSVHHGWKIAPVILLSVRDGKVSVLHWAGFKAIVEVTRHTVNSSPASVYLKTDGTTGQRWDRTKHPPAAGGHILALMTRRADDGTVIIAN